VARVVPLLVLVECRWAAVWTWAWAWAVSPPVITPLFLLAPARVWALVLVECQWAVALAEC